MNGVVKGTVLSVVNGKCRVAPIDNINEVSPKIPVPSDMTGLAKGDSVAYAVFSDGTGVLLRKM